MIEAVELEPGAPTTTDGTWDPQVNAVSYDRARYTSATADGEFSDDAAQQVVERVNEVLASQDQRR